MGLDPPKRSQAPKVVTQYCQVELVVGKKLRDGKFEGREVCRELQLASLSQWLNDGGVKDEAMQGEPGDFGDPVAVGWVTFDRESVSERVSE